MWNGKGHSSTHLQIMRRAVTFKVMAWKPFVYSYRPCRYLQWVQDCCLWFAAGFQPQSIFIGWHIHPDDNLMCNLTTLDEQLDYVS